MKINLPPAVKFTPLFSSLSITSAALISGANGAITQTFANTGSPTGSLASIGFDSYQFSQITGTYDTTSSVVGVQGPSFIGSGWIAIDYTFSTPVAPAGYQLTAVTLSIYIIDIAPASATTAFQIYMGMDRTGGVAGSFNLTEPTSELGFTNIAIPINALSGGFSLGYATNSASQPNFTTYTESHSNSSFHPTVTFTFEEIPETTSISLTALGTLGLLRRRRN